MNVSRVFKEPALPYVPAASPTDEKPHFKSGSSNIQIAVNGSFGRRAGFSKYITQASIGTINNIFGWSTWAGNYYIMLSVSTGGHSLVYYILVGTHTSWQLLHTDTTSTNQFTFAVSTNTLYFANGVDRKKWDGTTLKDWGIAGSGVAPVVTTGAGALTSADGGWGYAYAFGDSTDAHVGGISPITYTGAQAAKQFTVSGASTTSSRVDKVHIFRTLDGGATLYEHASSPIVYAAGWTFVDNSADITLIRTSQAPEYGMNERPPAISNIVFYAGRMWGTLGSDLYYSVFEEGINGIDEECFYTINKFPFGEKINRVTAVQKALLVKVASRTWRLRGDSLSTFLRESFLENQGITQYQNATGSARTAAWLTTANSILASDGVAQAEIGLPISVDLETIGQSTASMASYNKGRRKYLIVQDSALNKMWVYDQENGVWMPPWTFGGTAIWSGQVALATTELLVAKSGIVYKFDSTLFADDGVAYTATVTTGLNPLSMEEKSPDWCGSVEAITVESNSIEPTTVKLLVDEDPASGTYTDITAKKKNPPYRTQGTALLDKWYWHHASPGRRVSIQLNWAAAATEFKVYSMGAIIDPNVTQESGSRG